jgi:hypothetical protein
VNGTGEWDKHIVFKTPLSKARVITMPNRKFYCRPAMRARGSSVAVMPAALGSFAVVPDLPQVPAAARKAVATAVSADGVT